MTDEQIWAIVNAPEGTTAPALAKQLGVSASAVNHRRWVVRTQGWTCRVRFSQCLHCGELVTMSPSRSRTDRPYHPECRPEVIRNKVLKRYHAYPEERKRELAEKANDLVLDWQDASIEKAANRGAPWTEAEDAYLEANLHRTARELAEDLNRTFYGVASRMKRMRSM